MPIESNTSEIIARLRERQQKIDGALKITAEQCGVLAKSTTDPITPYKTGTLQGSVHPEISQIGPGLWQLWFGTMGAFGEDNYNYAPIQEFWSGFLATGWFLAREQFDERFKANMSELNNG
jgi:hypothetical protein